LTGNTIIVARRDIDILVGALEFASAEVSSNSDTFRTICP
jgi:hypothetical protein